jgi:hypothetical protein
MYSSRAFASYAARGTSASVRGADGNGSGQPATAVWPTVSSDCSLADLPHVPAHLLVVHDRRRAIAELRGQARGPDVGRLGDVGVAVDHPVLRVAGEAGMAFLPFARAAAQAPHSIRSTLP